MVAVVMVAGGAVNGSTGLPSLLTAVAVDCNQNSASDTLLVVCGDPQGFGTVGMLATPVLLTAAKGEHSH